MPVPALAARRRQHQVHIDNGAKGRPGQYVAYPPRRARAYIFTLVLPNPPPPPTTASSTPFSPAQLLEGLDGSSSPSSSRNNNNTTTTPGPGLRPNNNYWSSGGNRNNNNSNNRFNRFNNNSSSRNPTTASSAVGDALASMLAETSTREAHRSLRKAQTKAEASASLRKEDQSNAYMRQMPRRWTAGEVYAPHDLSPEEIQRYFRRELKPRFDVFDVLGFNPLDNYSVIFSPSPCHPFTCSFPPTEPAYKLT